ncbi:hypothetical protein OAO87_00275 [bacterium]|nr:hypothetical protein [bacterium]
MCSRRRVPAARCQPAVFHCNIELNVALPVAELPCRRSWVCRVAGGN